MTDHAATIDQRAADAASTPQPGTSVSVARPNPGAGIDYGLFLDCVHCGLCTAACPTYVELGNENDGPRGRIHLMRAVTDGRLDLTHQVRRHLELCLDCRACETACPSGVQYGRLIEPFRIAMDEQAAADARPKSRDWFHRRILFGLFPHRDRLRRFLVPARLAQRLGLGKLATALGLHYLLPGPMRRLALMLPPPRKTPPELPYILAAKGKRRARVALFTGCVGDVFFGHTHWATARVLQENGCDVVTPQNQVCCGAIHLHAGSSQPAREMADKNAAALDPCGVDAVIVNVAGCGAMLKDYGHHWAGSPGAAAGGDHDKQQQQRELLAQKTRDICQFLDDLGLRPPTGELRLKATYHDACHLAHAQKVVDAPRRLLAKIPGLEVRPLAESELCCGAAGTYNLTEPEMADRLVQRKLANIEATGARVCITANAGCILQIAREARRRRFPLKVIHPVELLDLSYRGESLEL